MGMDRDIYFTSADEAVAYCRKLALDGEVDLFRGQSFDWPVIAPSSFRGDDNARFEAGLWRDKFVEWAHAVPQMAAYQSSDDAIMAIAQHYGIPTAFLDLTTSPEIAELFARGSLDKVGTGRAVIYCFKSDELRKLPGFSILEIEVMNLWRLQAQHGLFLQYGESANVEDVRKSAIRIHYPRKEILPEETNSLYPIRKSALEIVIDQWIYRHEIGKVYGLLSGVELQHKVRRYTYPGAFRWRKVPELTAEWISNNSYWVSPLPENVADIVDAPLFEVSLADVRDPVAAYQALHAQFDGPVRRYANSGEGVEFAIRIVDREIEEKNASLLLNRCWDGVRAHPYSIESAIACMAATALGLIWGVSFPDDDAWEGALWGKVETVDTAPVGGHLEAANVRKEDLIAARHSAHNAELCRYYEVNSSKDPLFLMDYVVDPWILFDFSKFNSLFVEQFVPSCISGNWVEAISNGESGIGDLWGLSFNPALLGFVTRFGFRFHSPIAAEENVDRLIIVSPDMDRQDLEEIFVSALPTVLQGGEPFIVRFHGYGMDSREIWEIDRVVEQCKDIVEFGGLSVLEVLPTQQHAGLPKSALAPEGLCAIHVWAIANGIINNNNRGKAEISRENFDIFFSEIGKSNILLENLAKSQLDWPLS